MEVKVKKIIFLLICLFISCFLIQFNFTIINEKSLEGNVQNKSEVHFKLADWWTCKFQNDYEDWYNENFGFSKLLIRVNNQLLYSMLDVSKAREVLVGKGGHLFYENYINEYTGNNYVGEDAIDLFKFHLEKIQDTLAKEGITLITTFAAGPASYFPEDIPAKWGAEGFNSIYKSMSAKLSNTPINFIDFNSWFKKLKPVSKYPLFPKNGTHWSRYSIILVTDSLLKYIENKAGLQLPKLMIKDVVTSDSILPPDNDIYKVANIFANRLSEKLAYPDFTYQVNEGTEKFSLLGIGDSYMDMLYYYSKLTPACFKEMDFLPYYLEEYHSDGAPNTSIETINIKEEIRKHKVILLMATEANYGSFYWGFVDEVYNCFFESEKLQKDDFSLRKFKARIMKDQNWFKNIQKAAKKKNIPFENELTDAAIWLMNN